MPKPRGSEMVKPDKGSNQRSKAPSTAEYVSKTRKKLDKLQNLKNDLIIVLDDGFHPLFEIIDSCNARARKLVIGKDDDQRPYTSIYWHELKDDMRELENKIERAKKLPRNFIKALEKENLIGIFENKVNEIAKNARAMAHDLNEDKCIETAKDAIESVKDLTDNARDMVFRSIETTIKHLGEMERIIGSIRKSLTASKEEWEATNQKSTF